MPLRLSTCPGSRVAVDDRHLREVVGESASRAESGPAGPEHNGSTPRHGQASLRDRPWNDESERGSLSER